MKRACHLICAALVLAGATAASAAPAPDVLLQGPAMRLELDGGRLRVFGPLGLAAEIRSVEFNFRAPVALAPGDRSADRVILKATYPSDAHYSGAAGSLSVDLVVERVAGGFRFTASPEWARYVTVRLSDLDDHFFGILEALYPDNRPTPDLRGAVVDVDALGSGGQYFENYASAWSAFYMTARGSASFFDSFAKGRYRLGLNGETELHHQTGRLDWYVFLGRDGDELLASYYRVIGAPKAPPLWALGPIGWRDQNDGGAPEIVADVQRMTGLRIPFTGWFVDRPYSDGANEWSKMNFGRKFADPAAWIGRLDREFGLKFMTWIAPMTFGDRAFPGLFGDERGYMDLSNPAAVDEFGRRLAAQYALGVRGHKMDRAEEGLPEMASWKDRTPESEHRNKYLYLYAKVTHEALTRAWGPDHVNFARGAFHRTQPFLSAVWGGDSRASWAGLAGNLANAVRTGFLGFPVWGADTGGYLGGRIDEELYARWLEWAPWNGLFEVKLDNNGGRPEDRPPWVYGESLQRVFREACALRMRLLPYVYSLAQTSARTGVLMKPLAYVWPGDAATHAIGDEYLFGPAFLVAPITAPGGARRVYLPEGRWRDFHDPSRVYDGRQTIDVAVPVDRIPVFVRENTVYVTGVVPLGNRLQWEPSLKSAYTIAAEPGRDGESNAFELIDATDGNATKPIRLRVAAGIIHVTVPPLGAPAELVVRRAQPGSVSVNGRPVKATFEPAAGVCRIPLGARVAAEVEIGPLSAGQR
jgi:alpha-glucosidase (family GH31 glycosyl hydrolase)